jgi:hypothetical protein
MQLHFLEAVVSLLFVIHVEDFDQFEGHHGLSRLLLGPENEGKLALA